MLLPILIQSMYWGTMFLVVVAGLALILGPGIEVMDDFLGTEPGTNDVAWRLAGILLLFLGPVFVRVYAEAFIVVFRINETLSEIRREIMSEIRRNTEAWEEYYGRMAAVAPAPDAEAAEPAAPYSAAEVSPEPGPAGEESLGASPTEADPGEETRL